MSLETFTTSSLRNLQYHNNLVFYTGRFESRETAANSGSQAYRLVAKYPQLVLTSVDKDVDDDATIIAGAVPASSRTVASALIDKDTTRTASVSVQGVPYKVEQRDMQLGWKFTDAQGTKYKWNTKTLKTQWELFDTKKTVIATFDCARFWKDGTGILEFKTEITNELRVLALLSLSITAIIIARTQIDTHPDIELQKLNLKKGKSGMLRPIVY